MNIDVIQLFCISTIIPIVLLSIYLFVNKQNNNISKKLFAILLIIYALVTMGLTIMHSNITIYYMVGNALYIFSIIYGPTLFLYLLTILKTNFTFKLVYLLMYTPSILLIALFYVKTSLLYEFYIVHNDMYYVRIFDLLHTFVYLILCVILLVKYKVSFKSLFKKEKDAINKWLHFIYGISFLFWLARFFHFEIWELRSGCSLNPTPYTAIFYNIIAFIFFSIIAYIAITEPRFFSGVKKYESSHVKSEELEKCKKLLVDYIKQNKPYYDPELSLNKLASNLKISPKQLSQVINQCFNSNFYEFINSYRIEESKIRLINGNSNNQNIIEIMYDVGFNSKSTFNSAFKKYCGTTPREFKNRMA